MDDDGRLTVHPPLYLLSSQESILFVTNLLV